MTRASTNGSEGYLSQRAKRDKRADDFCKTWVPRHKMSFNCVEMSLFISVNVSSFCLFSYTFQLRSSIINIFFFVPVPNATLLPPPRPWNLPLRWMICSVFFASAWAFVLSPRRPGGGAAFRARPSHTSLIQSPPALSTEFLPYFVPVGRNLTKCLSDLLPGDGDRHVSWFFLRGRQG